jgi:hypothetical protein
MFDLPLLRVEFEPAGVEFRMAPGRRRRALQTISRQV